MIDDHIPIPGMRIAAYLFGNQRGTDLPGRLPQCRGADALHDQGFSRSAALCKAYFFLEFQRSFLWIFTVNLLLYKSGFFV
ncbi:hypothetical protein LNN86_10125 [Klebsiella pneumoniae subsp. pneumoniae]|nr:hypothetical protein [Klebsiella pneumoniae subsp. pneumoniae]